MFESIKQLSYPSSFRINAPGWSDPDKLTALIKEISVTNATGSDMSNPESNKLLGDIATLIWRLEKRSDSEVEPSEKVSYRIQIATESRELGVHDPKFSRFDNVKMYRHGGMYKYTVGNEADKPSALRMLSEVKSKGIKDAFIVIFRNGERIPQAEADKLMRR